MTTESMNIIEYIDANGIKWEPINMQIINGEKTLHQTGSYMPNTNDFEKETMETIKISNIIRSHRDRHQANSSYRCRHI